MMRRAPRRGESSCSQMPSVHMEWRTFNKLELSIFHELLHLLLHGDTLGVEPAAEERTAYGHDHQLVRRECGVRESARAAGRLRQRTSLPTQIDGPGSATESASLPSRCAPRSESGSPAQFKPHFFNINWQTFLKKSRMKEAPRKSPAIRDRSGCAG